MRKNMEKWNLTFRAINVLVGVILGLSIVYFIKEEFNLSILLGALTGTVILTVTNIMKALLKRDRTPDTDERTEKNMLKFYLFSSHIFIGLLFIALCISSFLGIEEILTVYLWIIIIAYICFSGIGAFIVSRR
ncbi:hypothetical protein [Paenibacillus senegalensis]|uniref:hypothetical protein n=1 Tax=Paenibacillus senegalensis TaxID=1465766 RepID=UPI0002889980|nr:hypothetical protein [Paenibacillus senegalensis]